LSAAVVSSRLVLALTLDALWATILALTMGDLDDFAEMDDRFHRLLVAFRATRG